MKQEAIFITKWKDEMKNIIKLRFGKLDKDKIDSYLDNIISKNMKNPRAILENNYTNQSAKTDVLSVIDLIVKNKLIIGGGSVLYQQHVLKDNPLIAYIKWLMTERKKHKDQRDRYKKWTDEWFASEISQNRVKTKNNSLYGATGYYRFVLYNRYIAESVTNQGRQIICSAAEGFEGFLTDSVNFVNDSELFQYIYNILNEYKDKYKDRLDLSSFYLSNSKFVVAKRLVTKCDFNINDKTIIHIEEILNNLSEDELVLLYYKNNLFEFNKLDMMKDKMEYIMNNTSVQIIKRNEASVPEVILIEDEKIKELKNDIWDFYKIFVFYDYPIFDRVRKAMYIDKKAVLYVDTDSNFLGLNRWIEFIKEGILNNNFNKPEKDVDFISVSICTLFLSNVVDGVLKTLCRSMNVTDEYAKLLKMKNEFYMEKILFTDKKKRYISNALLQEGCLLGDGLGLPEIKGFDFKKSTVKPFVTEFYTNICQDDILRTKDIKIDVIFKKMMELRKDIEESMKRGESKYYKQANIQIIEHYANPYSMQGIKGVILWNTLCPDYTLELPVDVDIVPIKDLSDKKISAWFEDKYPAEFTKIKQQIFSKEIYYKKSKAKDSASKEAKIMNLNYIAKPKNYDKELPPWFSDIVNTDKVINDILSLFYPILKSLGLKMLTTAKNSEHLSNIINL